MSWLRFLFSWLRFFLFVAPFFVFVAPFFVAVAPFFFFGSIFREGAIQENNTVLWCDCFFSDVGSIFCRRGSIFCKRGSIVGAVAPFFLFFGSIFASARA